MQTFGFAHAESSLGTVLAATSEAGLVSVLIDDHLPTMLLQLQRRFPAVTFKQGALKSKPALTRILQMAEDPNLTYNLPVDMHTTPFRKQIWQAIMAIPPGTILTYKDVAREAGSPRAMRAVGTACTHNHFSLIVPCHRVMHSTQTRAGHLSSLSLWRQKMLQRELLLLK